MVCWNYIFILIWGKFPAFSNMIIWFKIQKVYKNTSHKKYFPIPILPLTNLYSLPSLKIITGNLYGLLRLSLLVDPF